MLLTHSNNKPTLIKIAMGTKATGLPGGTKGEVGRELGLETLTLNPKSWACHPAGSLSVSKRDSTSPELLRAHTATMGTTPFPSFALLCVLATRIAICYPCWRNSKCECVSDLHDCYACAGISRDSTHKRRATGGKKKSWRKKRKYALAAVSVTMLCVLRSVSFGVFLEVLGFGVVASGLDYGFLIFGMICEVFWLRGPAL